MRALFVVGFFYLNEDKTLSTQDCSLKSQVSRTRIGTFISLATVSSDHIL